MTSSSRRFHMAAGIIARATAMPADKEDVCDENRSACSGARVRIKKPTVDDRGLTVRIRERARATIFSSFGHTRPGPVAL